ncbi:MAG TPA: hypothetical protein VGO21_05780 [Candidatus Paceibacterota bacterium]|jgi:Skp family chaperone for outer membrane proteins|nr:hypothetical protein [Candidatus Paceibacterota bacterium]
MLKKIIAVSGIVMSLALALPVLAETSVTTNTTDGTGATSVTMDTSTSAKIACVGVAVAAREAALDAAVATHADALKAAYATRATELAGAYANTTAKGVRAGVKIAWADFTKSVKSAANTWKTSRNAAWSAFRTGAKACKPPSGVSDSTSSSAEVSGL